MLSESRISQCRSGGLQTSCGLHYRGRHHQSGGGRLGNSGLHGNRLLLQAAGGKGRETRTRAGEAVLVVTKTGRSEPKPLKPAARQAGGGAAEKKLVEGNGLRGCYRSVCWRAFLSLDLDRLGDARISVFWRALFGVP